MNVTGVFQNDLGADTTHFSLMQLFNSTMTTESLQGFHVSSGHGDGLSFKGGWYINSSFLCGKLSDFSESPGIWKPPQFN